MDWVDFFLRHGAALAPTVVLVFLAVVFYDRHVKRVKNSNRDVPVFVGEDRSTITSQKEVHIHDAKKIRRILFLTALLVGGVLEAAFHVLGP